MVPPLPLLLMVGSSLRPWGAYAAVACDYIEVDIKENHVRHCNSSIEPIGCGVIFSLQALISIGLYDKAFLAREEEELMTRFINAGYDKLHLPLPLSRRLAVEYHYLIEPASPKLKQHHRSNTHPTPACYLNSGSEVCSGFGNLALKIVAKHRPQMESLPRSLI